MQPALLDPVADSATTGTRPKELGPGHDAVLALGDAADQAVEVTRMQLSPTVGLNVKFVRHRPRLAAIFARRATRASRISYENAY